MADASIGIRKDPNRSPSPEQIFKHQEKELISFRKSMSMLSMRMLGEKLEKPPRPHGVIAPKED